MKWFRPQTYISSPLLLKALFLDCLSVFLKFLQGSCTVNIYCTCVLACCSQQHCIQASIPQGEVCSLQAAPVAPLSYTTNNNDSTILVNRKPPRCNQKREAFQRDARTGPPRGRITGRTVPLCLSGLIGHMPEWSWLANTVTYRREEEERRRGEQEKDVLTYIQCIHASHEVLCRGFEFQFPLAYQRIYKCTRDCP